MLIKAHKKIDTEEIDQRLKEQRKKKVFHASRHKNKVEWRRGCIELSEKSEV